MDINDYLLDVIIWIIILYDFDNLKWFNNFLYNNEIENNFMVLKFNLCNMYYVLVSVCMYKRGLKKLEVWILIN